MSVMRPIAVCLVDGRPLWRLGIRTALELDQRLAVVYESAGHDFGAGWLPLCDLLVTSWPPSGAAYVPLNLRQVPTLVLVREGADVSAGVSALRAGAAACLYDHVGASEPAQSAS